MIYLVEGKLWMFIFLQDDLTMLPHSPYRVNQESISFFHFSFYLYYISYLGILATMFGLSVERVNWDTLETITSLDFCLLKSKCVIKLWEIFVRVILAPNLKFFTTCRSETLALISISWIWIVWLAQKPYHSKIFHPNMWGSPLDLLGKDAYECTDST